MPRPKKDASPDDLGRDELLALAKQLLRERDEGAPWQHLIHDLEVAQEELLVQNESLRHAQQLLTASRDRFTELYDSAPVGYLTLDGDGIIRAVNLTACTLLGVERMRLLSMPFLGHVVRADRLVLLDHLRRCRNGDDRVTSELRIEARDGCIVPCQLSSRLASENGATCFRTVITDLTETKWAAEQVRNFNAELESRVADRTAELAAALAKVRESEEREKTRAAELEAATRELREAARRKDEFLAMLGHELRNPLGPMRSAVEMLRIEGLSQAETREMRDVIERQIIHMARMTDDLLDVSRISRDKISLRRETVDLTDVVRETALDFAGEAAAAGLKLDLRLPERPLWCEGDKTRLAQVVGNLLHNAVKFTERGGAIEVSLAADDDHRLARLAVRDTGIGIAPEMLDSVFDTFSQAEQSVDRARGGLGLGLALVKGLVELHGGQAACSSDGLGKGSRFTISLPLAAGPKATARRVNPQVKKKSLRILVVDDRRDAAYTMAALLHALGHQTATAADGEEGLVKAREFRPEVVLSDIGLPKMDGYALARAMRADAELHAVYLIATTGYGLAEDRARALEAGFHDFLTKPVGIDALQNALASFQQDSLRSS